MGVYALDSQCLPPKQTGGTGPHFGKETEQREPLQTKNASLVLTLTAPTKQFGLRKANELHYSKYYTSKYGEQQTCGWGIPFAKFESVTAKLQHAFTPLPEGWGLMSPCNWVMCKRPQVIYLHQNCALNEAICNIRVMLRNSVSSPTHCKDLVASWPYYIRIVDASSHG
jgi:hypothetical protein